MHNQGKLTPSWHPDPMLWCNCIPRCLEIALKYLSKEKRLQLLLLTMLLIMPVLSKATHVNKNIGVVAHQGRSYATTYEQYAAFPRRRSSSLMGEMQSRAVDTRADFEVLEGQPRGTLVGYIPIKPKFTYRFNEPPREFTLDPVTGEVKTAIVLDREGAPDHYDLVVLSSQPTYPIEVRINVLDINDNAPEFPEPSIVVSFSESTTSGTRLLLDAATDLDIGENGVVTDQYEIVDGNVDKKFRLVTSTNPSGDTSYLHLETTGNLDRESHGFYQLNISGRDGGNPPRFGFLQVNVTILDVNDNPPIFDHSDYNVSLNETVIPGTPVLQVMASDNDLGDNSKITYYLAETERQFTVDPETGVISTTEPLNCPQQTNTQNHDPFSKGQKSCVFTVFARDHGSPRQDGRTYVTVNLVDTNDHDPIIRFQFFPPTGSVATVDENAINGTVVAAVSVIDSDDGLNGQTTTSIISGNELGHFRLEKMPLFHIVRVNGVLDREEISKYNLTVVAMDKGLPVRTATAHLIINVNDVNDHEPVFEKSEYSAVISELTPVGTFVASITATDDDTGVNAHVNYEIISGNDLNWFLIDEATGLIVTKGSLDREIQDSVELSISARDGGPNPKYAYTQLKVTVLDENDEAPKFAQQQINVSLSEDVIPQTIVAILTAIDHDQGTNGSVTYTFAPRVNRLFSDQFAIDSMTGQITTRKALDREKIANYEIHVIARDQGAPPQSATATVYLHVTDVNDNDPIFYPKHYFYKLNDGITIDENQNDTVLQVLIKVTATDLDSGDNALITYSLESGGEGIFSIDIQSGAIMIRRDIQHNAKPYYLLRISARDFGDRRSTQNAIVEIVVQSRTRTLDFSASDHYEFQIVEDHEFQMPQIGREVGRIQATAEKPQSNNTNIEYVIIYGDAEENFAIDRQSGHLTTARRIDREKQATYQLVVMARSNSNDPLSGLAYGMCSVHVSVLDLNDNMPSFSQDRDAEMVEAIWMPENTAVGQEIYVSHARDPDAGVNSLISYELSNNPDDMFRISARSGVIYLQRPVHAEPGTILQVELLATDGGTPTLSSKLNLPVYVVDVNDHTPVFDHTSYETSLKETTKVNTRFFALAATDRDLGDNGRISYEIIDGNIDNKFGIFPDGFLYVRASLDREDRDYYALTVSCKDSGFPSRSSVVPVVIHVIDENDNVPQFTNKTFTFIVPENMPAFTFVGKLTASDLDIGRNAELSYSLSTLTHDFTIDVRNGFIKTLRPFDREALVNNRRVIESTGAEEDRNISNSGIDYVLVEAIVSDNGMPRLHDQVKVKVIIDDVNDNAPEFLRTPYHVTISEGATVGTHIIHIFTQDADEGLNGDVFYSIAKGNEAGLFDLVSSTGQLTLARTLDRELQMKHQLIIVASDASPSQPLSSNTTINITVLDENDNAPEFTQSSSKVDVLESSPVGTELMRFHASDIDQDINSQVIYSITAGNRKDTFHIHSTSGSLYLHKSLDYEDTISYTLNITASDCGVPPLSTTILYTIIVVDENDNYPSFPNTAIVRQIKEGISLKTPIVTVTADDPDSGLNGKVTYAIKKQEPELSGGRHFEINAQSGIIYTSRDIDRETVDTFRLTVVATDQAEPPQRPLSTEKLVTVIVEDVNDNAPTFISMNAAILPIMQNSSSHLSIDIVNVIQVQARDADTSSNGLVTYEIVSGQQELFRLQRSTGLIQFNQNAQSKIELRYQLALKATDEAVQNERKSTETYITIITVGSSETNIPVFKQHVLSGSVYENEPIGTTILSINAELTGSEIEYYVTNVTSAAVSLSSGNEERLQVDRLFDIDTKLGILSTAAILDRESGSDIYEVEVYAIALGGHPRTARTKVKITVLDRNDSPPIFLEVPLIFNVSEDIEIGHSIGTIRSTDPDTIGTIVYSMIGGHDEKFLLESATGKLVLKEELDREKKALYDVRIRVSDGVQYTETNVIIKITDTNDNPPVFEEPIYSFDIPENSPRGYQLGQIIAHDADADQNAQVSYAVVSDWANDVFSLNPQTGVLTLTAQLDYEEVQHYILIVQAQDSGQPSLTNTITIYCNVLDLNDNTPIFDPMSYSSEVFENVPVGSEIVTVSAKDIDSGKNGLVEYSISAGDKANEFEILSNGTIRTTRTLDRERQNLYTLTIIACDSANEKTVPNMFEDAQFKNTYRTSRRYHELQHQQELLANQSRLSSMAQVTIFIRDVNDDAPVFISPNTTSVFENVAMNTVVFTVKALDRDDGRNGYIDYFINMPGKGEEGEQLPFTLNPTDGLLKVVDILDREVRSQYILNVTARDRGEPSLSTQTQLVINILDENDNSPVFDPKQYTAAVAENASIGAMVLQVSATDVDEGANGRVRYSITGGDQNHDFSISDDTGVVRVAKNLNFERIARYVLTVRAEDCGIEENEDLVSRRSQTRRDDSVKFTETNVIIEIIDINDNTPTFLDSPYLAYVMENTVPPNGGYILTVEAYDADSPPINSQVRYFLKEGNADLFRINASTGEISLLKALDRELQSEHILTLVAMDTGSPTLTGSGIVRVIVQDKNDHDPIFERQSYFATVEENLPIGSFVLHPVASDKDIGLNAKLRFNLLGEHINVFHIDIDTGELTTAVTLDREEISVYQLTLMAQDSSTIEPRASSVNLTIAIKDLNDNAPKFSASSYNVVIPDKIRVGEFVFGASALDSDEGDNAMISYNISGKDEQYFSVHPNTGVISTKTDLKQQRNVHIDMVYNIKLHATDHGQVQQSTTAELTILLRPIELFPSYSYMALTQFILSEDVQAGKMIAKLSATSPKKGAAGRIRYAIAGGNIGEAVYIDSNTGVLTVGKNGLDYELAHKYEIWVEAADSDAPSLRSVVRLSINITDINDNAPTMEKLIYYSEIFEEETPPKLIVVVTANDKDSSENGEINYRLLNDYDGTFEIDPEKGEIYTAISLDREKISKYILEVEAVDQGVPQLTGTASVIVNLLDKNDNPPKFARLYSLNVTENADIDSFVVRVTSSDLDIGINAVATYSFSDNPGEKFKIDSKSGNITVAAHLDREQQDEYTLNVVASDGAWRSETPVTITIQDQNDNAPEFEHSFYSFNFPELQNAMTLVGQITATDRDKQGPNSVISYALQQPSSAFSIDPATGELYSKKRIHYKRSQTDPSPENIYTLSIIAIDNGKPPLNSECLIKINIVDANNNPPKFEQLEYISPLPEHARIGQRIVRVHALDKHDVGVNAKVDYMLVSTKNVSDQFLIGKHDGWISLAKRLDVPTNSRYVLTIKATDRGVPPLSDQTRAIIIVTGENYHKPEFTALSYQVIVPENEPIGSTILTVSATDKDDGPNGMLRYAISSGNERSEFSVNEKTGAITLMQSLDFDLIQEYHLNISVVDLGFQPQSAVAMLTIILTDANDNPPIFNQSKYDAYLAENKPAGAFVFQAHATDKDSPKNAIVQYAITTGPDRHYFNINPSNGIISSATIFDYEERRTYIIQLKAGNPDSVMESYATLHIHITGVNEFYPQFIQPVFHFDVSETSAIGTAVGTIMATDKDNGEDGHVYYLLVGSSNDKGFGVNTHTGVLHVTRHLDRETQNRVVLTVIAKNYGSIRGNDTDEAQVIIAIQDGNDPPEFIKRYYSSTISEAAPLNTKITIVKAVDKDIRPQNNQFNYSIINGNIGEKFKIDAQTGEITTAATLDREDIAHYNLVVGAIDTGLPPQTGSATVHIDLDDVNDNGPTLSSDSLMGYIMENEPVDTKIMTLVANDPDLPRNGPPFSYYLVGGKHKSWLSIDKYTGLVKSTLSYDRELTPNLEAIIEIEDSGKPKQKARYTIIIKVLDQNDNPSMSRTVHVAVSIFNNEVPSNIKLANIRPNDVDIVGNYHCQISQEDDIISGQLIIPNSCDLYSTSQTIPTINYMYNVTSNDGKHNDVISKVTVSFRNYNNATLESTVALLIYNMTADQFLMYHYYHVFELLAAQFTANDDLSIYSIINNGINNTNLEVLLTMNSIKQHHQRQYLVKRLREKRSTLSELLQTDVIVDYNPCYDKHICINGGVCSALLRLQDANTYSIIDSPTLVLSSPRILHDYKCQCAEGFAGEQCNRQQDPCLPNPCSAQVQCRRIGYDYQCICPPDREGKQCQMERSDVCWGKPCRNGGTCQRSQNGSSFFCICRPGYRGSQCESITDPCRPSPCLHGGLCVSLKPGYKCTCTLGHYGRHCERYSYGFSPLSYMAFPSLEPTTNDISIVFTTTKSNALLLYNYGIQSGGRSDFVAIELVRGQIYFSTGGIRTAISTVIAGHNLADGNWHRVTATRNGRVMSLSTASCTESGEMCTECLPGDSSCYSNEMGPLGTLNFNKQPLLIGGLTMIAVDHVLERPGQIHSDDFVGCVHSVSINGRFLNLSTPLQQNGILLGCHQKRVPCQPLVGSGHCSAAEMQCHEQCQCGEIMNSSNCINALAPIALTGGAFIEFKISEQHRRMQLLDTIYSHNDGWTGSRERRDAATRNLSSASLIYEQPKLLSVLFRTYKSHGIILYSASNQMHTSLSLDNGKLVYYSKHHLEINMTIQAPAKLHDGKWHNVSLHSISHALHVLIDGQQVGDELDLAGVHDFLDPYLTTLTIGGVPTDRLPMASFAGCVANFSINNEIQPLNGSGRLFSEVVHHGSVKLGCNDDIGIDAAQVADPLSIGITLVVVFFIILIVAILGSYVIYRFRGKQEKIGSLSCGVPGFKLKHGANMLGAGSPAIQNQSDHMLGRSIHPNEIATGTEHLRPSPLHVVGPELITKKFKDRSDLPHADHSQAQQRIQRPDIIDREVVGKSPPIREDHHLSMPPLHQLDPTSSVDLGSDYPEHYDLENASSIAPSDIDIVYHYKGYREAGGVRKYKTTSPPVTAYTHHKHQPGAAQQHRHSPRHVVNAPFVPRVSTQGVQQPPSTNSSRNHQSTPLARLSPSSELSSQQPRILTLHDISGKPLQSALLATTSSSGGVGKDVLHSNSERSLNSPVMSQLSGQSSRTSRQKSVGASQAAPQTAMGLTAEEIERLNARPRTSSLVSTLDAVSSSSEQPRVSGSALHLTLGTVLHSTDVDAHSSSSTDESGNDSFTCSEIEYDNNSLSGEGKFSTSKSIMDGRSPVTRALSGEPSRNTNVGKTPPVPPHAYDGFDTSFRGSLSTLVASDDDLTNHLTGIYHKTNGTASPSATLGWEYLLNWGPSYENLMGVFKDIAELPDTVSQQQQQSVSTLRMPSNIQKASEEYV